MFFFFSRRDLFYHEGLVDAWTTIASKDMDFRRAISILYILNGLRHVNNSLLDYIAAKCFEDPNLLTAANSSTIQCIIDGLKIADYKPVFWDTIREALMTSEFVDKLKSDVITNAVHLASFDVYSSPLLSKAFILATDTKMTSAMATRILLLYHLVKLNCPEYDGPWPSKEFIDKFSAFHDCPAEHYPAKRALESALGGPQYVITRIKTSIGYYARKN